MTVSSTVQFAAALREEQVLQFAQERFPGIEGLVARPLSLGGFEARETVGLVGSWHGAWVGFDYSLGAVRAYVVAECRCCHTFSQGPTWGGPIPDAAAIAEQFEQDPPAFIDQCRPCSQLHEAQAEAVKATSRLSRWLFRVRHEASVEEVLARSHRGA